MKQFLRTAGILALVCFVAALLLAVTARLTTGPIAQTAQKKKDQARSQVLPAASYQSRQIPNPEDIAWYLDGYRKRTGAEFLTHRSLVQSNYSLALDVTGKVLGYIFDLQTPGGYGGRMDIVVGVRKTPEKTLAVSDYHVIYSQETPGLGKAVESSLHMAFTNRPQTHDTLDPRDRKNDCISGATITSVAIKDAAYAALRMATVLAEREFEFLEIPQSELAIIPYSQTYESIQIPAHEMVRECLDVRWFGQTSGYLFKIVLRDDASRKKYLALAGLTALDGRLFETRLYEMPLSTNQAFIPVFDFRSGIFSRVEVQSLLTNAGLGKFEKILAQAIADGRAMLRKAGTLP
jgi:RnfABCDGE-type electron transport complex G subunit